LTFTEKTMPSLTKAAPKTIEVVQGDKTYALPTLALAELRKIQEWLDGLPSPLARCQKYAESLPENLRNDYWVAMSTKLNGWPPKLGSPEAEEALSSLEGLDLLIRLMLRKGQPSLKDSEIEVIAGEFDLTMLGNVLLHALGIDPVEPGDSPDPKDPK
jgi:hypothetical protein